MNRRQRLQYLKQIQYFLTDVLTLSLAIVTLSFAFYWIPALLTR